MLLKKFLHSKLLINITKIDLQRPVLPGVGGHCCTALFVFYKSNSTYVTIPSLNFILCLTIKNHLVIFINDRWLILKTKVIFYELKLTDRFFGGKTMANIHTPEQKQQKAETIAKVAGEIFQEKGFNQISMSEIAKRAGMSKGTLFNYYKTKEDLFMTVLLVGYQKYFTELAGILAMHSLKSVGDFKLFLLDETKNLIKKHTALIRLNALRGPILESNSNLDETLANRQKLYDISKGLSQLIHSQVPELTVNKVNHIFVVQSAIISGLMNLAELEKFDHRPTGQPLTDFEVDITNEAQVVLKGYLNEVIGGPDNETRKYS